MCAASLGLGMAMCFGGSMSLGQGSILHSDMSLLFTLLNGGWLLAIFVHLFGVLVGTTLPCPHDSADQPCIHPLHNYDLPSLFQAGVASLIEAVFSWNDLWPFEKHWLQ